VAADGRSRLYRQSGFTSRPITKYAVLSATGRKYGLCAMASRTVCFGSPGDSLRQDHSAACKVAATYIASSWPDAVPREILTAGRRVYLISGYEHEWLHCPQGHVTGRSPIEMPLLPATEELFQNGWAITWQASTGAACSCDTFVLTANGPALVTEPDGWPLKRIRVQGTDFARPDLLER
jgi:hypothetical protein